MTPQRDRNAQPRRLRPTDLLKAEHRQIEEQLDMLTGALRELGERGSSAGTLDRIESVARFIDEEMSTHHRKEEEELFPFLHEFLDAEDLHLDGRIADHEDLKIMSGKFKDALEDCRRRTEGPGRRFAAQMLRGYGLYIVHLVREHLLKEDEILFLVADRYLSAEQERQIIERFAEIERSP